MDQHELTFCIVSIVVIAVIAHKLYSWNISLYAKIFLTILCLVAKLAVIQHYAEVRAHHTVRPRDCSSWNKAANWVSFSGFQCPAVDPNKIPTSIYLQIYFMDFFLSIFMESVLYTCDSVSRSFGINNIWLSLSAMLGSAFTADWIVPLILLLALWFGFKFARSLHGWLTGRENGVAPNGDENDDNRNNPAGGANEEANLLQEIPLLILSYFTTVPENSSLRGLLNKKSFLNFSKFISKYFNTLPMPYNYVLIVIFVFLTIIWSIAIWFGRIIYGDGFVTGINTQPQARGQTNGGIGATSSNVET